MTAAFTAKALFGLGVTSSVDFVTFLNKYKAAQEAGVAYISATSTKYPSKSTIVVFEGVRELFRCWKNIRPHQIIVVSDVPSLLKEVSEFVPLDYDQQRSFEFNFKEVDPQPLLRALRSKTATVTSTFTGYDCLGYHVERVKNSGDFMAALIALNAPLNFAERTKVRRALFQFFLSKTCDINIPVKAMKKAAEGHDAKVLEASERFIAAFKTQGAHYYAALHSGSAAALASKKFNVDQYAVSYFKRIVRSFSLSQDRMTRNGHTAATHT